MNPHYPPPPYSLPAPLPRMSSSTAQVLGKRKHDDHDPAAISPSPQIEDICGFSSQCLSYHFPARQFHEPLSIEFMMSRYQGVQSAPPGPTLTSKAISKATAPPHPPTFVHSTVQSIHDGQRPQIDRPQTWSLMRNSEDSPDENPQVPLQPPRPKRQVLLPSRPLQNSKMVHDDVWFHVLSFCEPKLLLEAKTLNRFFYHLLSDNSTIWRKSRTNHYGSDMPECPKGLTEKQYVELLAGRGCQSKGCHLERTSKVHWMFQVRLCPECFKKKTMNESDLARQRRHRLPSTADHIPPGDKRPLWELLPLARTDGRRDANSRPVNAETNDWVRESGKFAFLKASYARLESQFQLFGASDPEQRACMEWASKIHKETMEFMADVNKLEAWFKEHTKRVQGSKAQTWRQLRIDYFEARAAELSPPMDRNILWKMAAFTRILKVPQEATARSWDSLLNKIAPYRLHAQQVEGFERLMASDFLEAHPQVKLFRRLHEHRSGREAVPRTYRPEQKFVLQLAQAVFVQCVKDEVADEDLLLLCLRNVFDSYSMLQNRPIGLNFDGTTGPYCLSLDDARMIVEDVLERRVPPNSEQGAKVFQSLKCRGCRRADHVRTFSFVQAFEHILQTHTRQVGEGLEYYQFAIPHPLNDLSGLSPEEGGVEFRFPWYTVLWPRNLPLVPRHQDVLRLDTWHPAVPTEFVPLSALLRVSAFHGRRPLQHNHAADDFGQNLAYAARQLSGTWLEGSCQMKIALQYALDLYAQKHTREPPLSTFMGCLEDLANATSAIQLRFRCGVCPIEDKRPRSSKRSKHKTSMEFLHIHWEDKHQNGTVPWTRGFMCLPSDDEVSQQIADADKKLNDQKRAFIERSTILTNNIKKRTSSKGNVLFEVKQAREAFDGLFPKVA